MPRRQNPLPLPFRLTSLSTKLFIVAGVSIFVAIRLTLQLSTTISLGVSSSSAHDDAAASPPNEIPMHPGGNDSVGNESAAKKSHQWHQQQGTVDQNRNYIVYLSQGPASSYIRLQHRFNNLPNALFFYHSYDQECNGCIFLANTTLPRGRNLVLMTALQSLMANQAGSTSVTHVKYFIMMDDDVEVQCIPSRRDCWFEYHTMLLDQRTTWPLLAPKFYVDGDAEPALYHTCRDDSLWVMRWDYVHLLYPFPTKHDKKTWNIYVQAVWERMKRCFPNGFHSHKGYRNVNPRHGTYPKGLRKGLVVNLLNDEYPTLGPWKIQKTPDERPFRCTPALKEPPLQQQADPKCTALTKSRFERWMNGTLVV
ncbi:hypothetical protein IV203_004304 [Nitzschia inconspicua]|uniref:Uncharacterized protein n=1 Tax=Nitzschia inconspicua TaxID=303405 RepID=A0A9K3L5D9_9STRA|nr:hypothetical protein IV203_004304 [Nitzschia inconspicua]